MRLLVVEDSVRLRESLVIGLRAAGFAVDEAADGERGLWLAESNPYDVLILDLMLPLLDGLGVLRRLRENGCDASVLILTAKDHLDDKVRGLRAGADDYLVKPFAFEELLARVQAMVRRAHGRRSPTVTVRNVTIDTVARTVHRDGARVDLPAREYALLEYFAMNRGRIVGRTEIESHLYDEQADLMSNVVDAAIYALRKKLDGGNEPSIIRTHRGLGYELSEAGQ